MSLVEYVEAPLALKTLDNTGQQKNSNCVYYSINLTLQKIQRYAKIINVFPFSFIFSLL